MKVILEFELPDEFDNLNNALNASGYKWSLYDLDQWLRGELKYKKLSKAKSAALQECRDKLHEVAQSHEAVLE